MSHLPRRRACRTRSVIVAAAHALENGVDAAPGVHLVGDGMERLTGGRRPGYEHVEVEVPDELESLEVGRAIARSGSPRSRRPPCEGWRRSRRPRTSPTPTGARPRGRTAARRTWRRPDRRLRIRPRASGSGNDARCRRAPRSQGHRRRRCRCCRRAGCLRTARPIAATGHVLRASGRRGSISGSPSSSASRRGSPSASVGCLSLDRCRLANPGDRAARLGPGPRYWIGDRPG